MARINQIAQTINKVQQWQNREGVVIHMSGGQVVKAKSLWWYRSGFTQKTRRAAALNKVELWRLIAKRQLQMLSTKQRLAVVGWPMGTTPKAVFQRFQHAKKAELVFCQHTNVLRVVIVSFETEEDMKQEWDKAGAAKCRMRPAYSSRTRSSKERRVMVVHREQCD